jgi:hypothetical protein
VLLAVLAVYVGQARADVTSDTPGSIVIFPKVIADGTRDTLIQLTNTSNMGTSAHCWYFDATNNCQPANFFVDLTPQQPIFWRASSGRFTGERRCDEGAHNVCTSVNDCVSGLCVSTPGIFLGNVPPRIGFQGELKCIEVDSGGIPIGRNSLKGEALLETYLGGQVSEYNAIAVQAMSAVQDLRCSGGANNGSTCTGASSCCDAGGLNCGTCTAVLKLDNDPAHYNACPRDLVATHYAQGAADLFTGAIVRSEITLVPCTEDIENDRPTTLTSVPVIANFRVVDELESSALSGGIPFTCWLNLSLDDVRLGGIYDSTVVGRVVKTRIPTNSGAANVGVLGVFEEFHTLGTGPVGTATINFHGQNSRSGGDVITVPQQTGSN